MYYEGAIEDVTERKQVEEERKAVLEREQAARAQAEAANRMKDEFLATLSHELRTPLNAMLGWANLARALETIERNAKAQNQMIEDLLDVSRIIRSKLRLTICPINLISVIDAGIDVVRLAATAKAINLEKYYDLAGLQGQGLVIAGDASRLQQIVWNLLSNAIKFTPVGGRVEVRLSVVVETGLAAQTVGHQSSDEIPAGGTTDNLSKPVQASVASSKEQQTTNSEQNPTVNYVQIQVKDNGQGISADFLPHLFEHFRQADSTSTRSQGGLGLGLAIVRQLVEMHGGTVCAYSPGIGQRATFTVKLPLMTKVMRGEGQGFKEREYSLFPNASSTLRSPQHSFAPLTLEGLQILIVDDEVDTREMLTTTLEFYGATVSAVASVAEAKIAIALSPPDILLSDIAMPESDGYVLISYVRQQAKPIPAIALTAYARESDRNAAIAAGFQRHISKPVEPEELVAVVAELLVASK